MKYLGSPGRTRTADRVVNSHLLYQLSYRGIRSIGQGELNSAESTKNVFYQKSGYGSTNISNNFRPLFGLTPIAIPFILAGTLFVREPV
jgi:hypothetical protein